jgi:predicted PurR-regulated permease PerM
MASDPAPGILTPAQRRLVGFAAAFAALLAIAAGLIAALYVLGQLVGFFSGVLWPLAVAGVLAVVLRPVVTLLHRRLKISRIIAVVLIYGVVLVLGMAVITRLLPPLVSQLVDLAAYLRQMASNPHAYLVEQHPGIADFVQKQLATPMVQRIITHINQEAATLTSGLMPSLQAAGGGVIGAFAIVAHIAVVPVYLFFFLLSRGEPTGKLADHLPFLSPGLRDDVVFLVREFIAIVESFFRGQLIIGLIMGVLLAIGFSVIGLRFGLFLGLALGVFNIVPYLGTILGLAAALPMAFFQPDGGWKLVGLVLLVKIIVQAVEGWYLTPKIMGDRTGLHPVTIMVAIFFWGTAFGGVLGMLLAIPLTAFFVTAWRLARHKYFEPIPESRA